MGCLLPSSPLLVAILAAVPPFAAASSRFPAQVEATPQDYPTPEEKWFDQQLDHFNPADDRQWSQRYLIGQQSWDGRGTLANGCRGPILLYTGNEGPIEGFWQSTGFIVQELAPRLGALLLYPEQRYYGKSMPFGHDSLRAENAHYLTTAQVLEDIVTVVDHVKQIMAGAADCPVVAFGGSYGGTLTALLRASRPSTIVGGVAASSELGYYDLAGWAGHGVDEFTFEDVVVSTWANARPGCFDVVQAALRAIDAEGNVSYVANAFGACDSRALGSPKSTLFAYVLEGMPQEDYPSLGFPVSKACDALLAAARSPGGPRGLIDAAARVARSFLSPSPCVAFDVGGPGNTPGDGPSLSSWGYQSCTETLHAFSARAFRNFSFDATRSSALCGELYNYTVRPDVHALARQFGGAYSLAEGTAGVSHLIWTQGTLDPWHGWFKEMRAPLPESENYHIVMEGSAHHTDLRAPHTADPPSVVAARAQEEQIITRWISEAAAPAVVVV